MSGWKEKFASDDFEPRRSRRTGNNEDFIDDENNSEEDYSKSNGDDDEDEEESLKSDSPAEDSEDGDYNEDPDDDFSEESLPPVQKSKPNKYVSDDESDEDFNPKKRHGKSIRKSSRIKSKRKLTRLADDDEDDDYPAFLVSRSSLRSTNKKNYAESSDDDEAGNDDEEGENNDHTGGPDDEDSGVGLQGKVSATEEEDPSIPAVEMILDRRVKDGETEVFEYLVKWMHRSHIHNTWETEETLKGIKGYRRVLNFIKIRDQEDEWRRQASPEDLEQSNLMRELDAQTRAKYIHVEKIIGMRKIEVVSDSQDDQENSNGDSQNDETMDEAITARKPTVKEVTQYFVKWHGLAYSDCTWEVLEDISQYQEKIDEYLDRDQNAPNYTKKKIERPPFKEYESQPDWINQNRKGAKLELRDYQLHGLNWMLYSWSEGVNVILADEMGLGKTIQTICFLGSLYQDYGVQGPFLVVVPLSTIAAWRREFAIWAPFFNTVVYRGDQKSREICRNFEFYVEETKNPKFHVLLTTYELIRRDRETLMEFKFRNLMVDEAHRLKDIESALYQDLYQFNTDSRLLITGTPLQNSMKELWCLLHFLDPKKFDSVQDFEERFGGVMEGDAISALHETLRPHLLRRVKKEVEKSLPNKIERILRVELSEMQKRYYKLVLSRNYQELNKGVKGNASSLLNIVMELKKCCNHPYLFESAEPKCSSQSEELRQMILNSGKMILLDKLLTRLKETGHRVLIFSQMVRMLDILSDYLRLKGYSHQRLDGTMKSEDRIIGMDRFNSPDSQDFAFLLSTRAGGLGINLATADTVIIFDSDWNPQNDLQAEARAHRIGQKNVVNIYRLVTKQSVEEQILERAKQKMILDHLVIQRMDTSGQKQNKKGLFDRKELAKILQFGAKDLFQDDKPANTAEGGDKEAEGGHKEAEASTSKPKEKLVADMDIDEILARAETKQEVESNETDEFLSAFKVATFSNASLAPVDDANKEPEKLDPNFWSSVIPADMIQTEADSAFTAYVPRKAAQSVKSYAEKNFGAEASAIGPASIMRNTKSERKRTQRTPKLSPDKNVRQMHKYLIMFGKKSRAIDELCKDHSGSDKAFLEKIADEIIAAAEEAVKLHKPVGVSKKEKEKEKVIANVQGHEFEADVLLDRIVELDLLSKAIAEVPDPYKNFRVKSSAPQPKKWKIRWSAKQDSMLLLGVHVHGLNIDAIVKDPDLQLNVEDSKGERLVKTSVLQTRIAKLLESLRKDSFLSRAKESKSDPAKSRKRKQEDSPSAPIRQSSRKRSRAHIPSDYVSSDVVDKPELLESNDVNQKPEFDSTISRKRARSNSQESLKPMPKKSKTADSSVAESGQDQKPGGKAAYDKELLKTCKTNLGSVKSVLRDFYSLEKNGDRLKEFEKFSNLIRQIGDEIERLMSNPPDGVEVSNYEQHMWHYLSVMSSLSGTLLRMVYNRCKENNLDAKGLKKMIEQHSRKKSSVNT